ncbi:lipoate--protein ligase family protein [Candidatus Woesearchaeota archaeon]|nr:lipoate--protein ligase family protein [Candidatus Woesearchaeota archaeon]
MQFRVIPLSVNSGYMNMAIDEVLLNSSNPVIRFYDWMPSSVSFGFFQNVSKVNVGNCKKLNVDYVRRITGGGSILHDNNKEITYSVIAPLSLYSKNLVEAYKEICKPILDTLSYLGLKPSISNANDIAVNGKKISGNAQVRRENALLQHGTLIYDVDFEKMLNVLNTNLSLDNVNSRITFVKEHFDISKDGLYKILKENFCKKDHFFDSLTEDELSLAQELAENKYKTSEWNNGTNKEKLKEACYLS